MAEGTDRGGAAATALIAEDEPLLAQALRAELAAAWPELEVLATVGDGAAAVRSALAHRPDVLFFDIRMPGLGGLDAAARLRTLRERGLHFRDCLLKARGLHGLEHVVDRLRLEGLDGVLVVRGDEHQRGEGLVLRPFIGQLHGGLQPALPRHADVEEEHVGP
jgi:CheY-like chemotaxis protein